MRVVVVGAGVGGLTTAARLARAGFEVDVVEAHVYAGGCAGTFFHKRYRFDAGATLAGGFYEGGPMDRVAKAVGLEGWPTHSAEPAMVVHLPNGQQVTRWTDKRREEEHLLAFGAAGRRFWQWQEETADALWDLAMRLPPWPAQEPAQWFDLTKKGLGWLFSRFPKHLSPRLLLDAFRPVGAHLRDAPEALRYFVDAQLLIAAQTTSQRANALYGASALDLPRRGVVHLKGGMGAIAECLVEAVRRNGGRVHFRQEVDRLRLEGGRIVSVETKAGASFPADLVICNLSPWDIRRLLGENTPKKLRDLPEMPDDGWGAFMVYVGLKNDAIPKDWPLHHQVLLREPMGEGNTAFLSLAPAWDTQRAPAGHRPLTISTHTSLRPWWSLFQSDREAYEAKKKAYAEMLLDAAQRALPSLREGAALILPGTPVTFQRFTRRQWGWVGGFPQVDLFRAWGPKIREDLWMVGDSIFPGQSTAAVALGGLRVAEDRLLPKRSVLG